ncbi:class I SAM-dependent methyltransferase [Proteiniclasticum sp. QWL-01]|uniref:tRNA (mnm(5)s(2)U34)-methyltransferase n=1 Tax=Proteiniclasticum sp. QWL-01 TaxID=3036945 RepID=UPI0021FF6421|nr:class I SAM-dependent methyltransferase [Proteiniclasticum sp. QWL-01]UUM13013.1 class I SAM-dependent methyltransferase [Clostridiaceae bacterium HFYG-1003]WFF71438.1 class I SAM-dependent methyltransferase [Proteiniclasticum sp. QWL-01]
MSRFSLVTGVSDLSHRIIRSLFPDGGKLAMDCTLGNGHDADFLADWFEEVIAMDILPHAVENYPAKSNVMKYCMDHAAIESFHANPDLIVYNLGYLPGGDKQTTTTADRTIPSLQAALHILRPGGFISIALYTGHDGGEEARAVLDFVQALPERDYGVIHYNFINRSNQPPSLLTVEKRKE